MAPPTDTPHPDNLCRLENEELLPLLSHTPNVNGAQSYTTPHRNVFEKCPASATPSPPEALGGRNNHQDIATTPKGRYGNEDHFVVEHQTVAKPRLPTSSFRFNHERSSSSPPAKESPTSVVAVDSPEGLRTTFVPNEVSGKDSNPPNPRTPKHDDVHVDSNVSPPQDENKNSNKQQPPQTTPRPSFDSQDGNVSPSSNQTEQSGENPAPEEPNKNPGTTGTSTHNQETVPETTPNQDYQTPDLQGNRPRATFPDVFGLFRSCINPQCEEEDGNNKWWATPEIEVGLPLAGIAASTAGSLCEHGMLHTGGAIVGSALGGATVAISYSNQQRLKHFQVTMEKGFEKLTKTVDDLAKRHGRTEQSQVTMEKGIKKLTETQVTMEKGIKKLTETQVTMEKGIKKLTETQVTMEKRFEKVSEKQETMLKDLKEDMRNELTKKLGETQETMRKDLKEDMRKEHQKLTEKQETMRKELKEDMRKEHQKLTEKQETMRKELKEDMHNELKAMGKDLTTIKELLLARGG